MNIREFIQENILVLDGAMGTMLQKKGMKIGGNPECLNIQQPDILIDIYKEYILSGANVITTNTFGANEIKLKKSGYTVEEIIDKAVFIAKKASYGTNTKIGLDIGPIGEMLEPMGTLSFDRAYDIFKRQIVQGIKSGVDLIIIETMTDLYEVKAAVLAAKENSDLPIFCTMTFEENKRTFTGCAPKSMVLLLEGLGVDALGVNCSLGPKQLEPIVEEIVKYTNLPVIVQANAGLPVIENGETKFNVSEVEFAEGAKTFIEIGASIIGGCCGTTPEYISNISTLSKNIKKIKRPYIDKCAICTPSKVVDIDRVRIIGERVNPTGKSILKEALKEDDIDYVLKLAIEQVDEGADILNINVGLPEIDEKYHLKKIIKEIQSILDIPLQIDSSDIGALENGLRYYNGKTIVNSVNGEDKSLDSILPLVKKYGAAVVGLTLDEEGVPNTAEKRLYIAEKIVNRAMSYGINKENIFIDCLVLTVSAQQAEVKETLEAVRLVKEKLGVKTILGISNISYGLPNRKLLNKTFLSLALANGLDLPIINPNDRDMIDVISCFNGLYNYDKGLKNYIDRFSKISKKDSIRKENDIKDLRYIVNKGLKEEAEYATKELLKNNDEDDVLNKVLIPALDEVGKKYEDGVIFLPQLIQSAETVKKSLEVLKFNMKKNNNIVNKGTIILATVKGDVHDIGKNIVKIILENYGYKIVDLGKDTPIEKVIEEAKKHSVKLIGLSALMTTTVNSMEETINAIRENKIDAKIFVGGAVLTEEYANTIGADYYAKDAKDAVDIAKLIFNNK